jgi:NitT/TauT family transport system permease protein
MFSAGAEISAAPFARAPGFVRQILRAAGWIVLAVIIVWILFGVVDLVREVRAGVSSSEMLHIVWLGFLTLLRVFAMTIAATLIWTPIGVWIGSKPRVARIAQPIAQIAASFPVNMTFPFIVGFFILARIPINFGSIVLIALGTQWYILFNVIAGSMSIPTDLKECANIFGMRGWRLWRTLIIPAIFPFWVTGAVTAAGGAWNASIVAEVATWGKDKLVADGLGAYIAQVTEQNNKPALYFAVVVMSIFVVCINRVLWRRLYDLAERRFTLS